MYDTTKPYKKEIVKLIRETWETPYVSVRNFLLYKTGPLRDYGDYYHVDGIGTKGVYHWQKRTFSRAVYDALAQNLNDLAVMRATPFAIIDHIFLPEDDHVAAVEIVQYLAMECRARNIAICGGDIAIHDTEKGLEISIAMMGSVRNPQPNKFMPGDVLVALGSSGLHANGFTKVRQLFGGEFKEEFTVPTMDYHRIVSTATIQFAVRGMVHVAGGAFYRLKNMVEKKDTDVIISRNHSLKPQPIFEEIYSRGVKDEEMYKIFNCGIGFFIGMSGNQAGKFIANLHAGINADIVGAIIPGRGKVKIQSQFSKKMVVY